MSVNVGGPAETRYATSGDVQIAYQSFGDGPDLVWVPGWVPQHDLYWEEPALARFLRRLASFSRVIVFDRRGLGLSDRVAVAALPTLETRMDDVRAVLDDLGLRRATILGQGYASPIAVLFAATYPERTSSLVLYAPSAKGGLRTDDHTWGATPESTRLGSSGRRVCGARRSSLPSGLPGLPPRPPATTGWSSGRLASCAPPEAPPHLGLSRT